MKKILIIGAAESIFVQDFAIQYAKIGASVDLITFSETEKIAGVRKQINCSIPSAGSFGSLGQQISLLVKLRKILQGLDCEYDSVVIHYINFFLAPHILNLKKITANLVSVIWGSDFYGASFAKGLIQNIIFQFSDTIVFTNPITKATFQEKKRFISRNSLKVARFGLPALDEIKHVRAINAQHSDLCQYFRLPIDKVIILVGYNANLAQQQILIIDKFAQLEPHIRESAHLVFPLGYGDKGTEESIRKHLERRQIKNFSLLTKFYDFSEIAKLRCITDVLINIQSSDQFSGSMQETLYAGGRVIAGSWLPYQDIIELGADIEIIDSAELVGDALNEQIKAGRSVKSFASPPVKDFIDRASSWDSNIDAWNAILFKNSNMVGNISH